MAKFKPSKKLKTTLIIIGVILLATGAGFGLRWYQQLGEQRQQDAADALSKKVNDIQRTALSGNYDAANKALTAALNDPKTTNEEKASLYIQQGSNYENQKDYDNAIKSYQAAAAITETEGAYSSMARVAEAKGDFEAAKTYYKKAIELILPSNPLGSSDKTYYQYRIDNMGKPQ